MINFNICDGYCILSDLLPALSEENRSSDLLAFVFSL